MSARVAVVTGASRGLGLALARRLAADGWALVVDGRDPAALEAARADLARVADVRAVAGDVSDAVHRAALGDAVDALGGRVDALVLNASTLGPSPQPPLAHYPLDALRRVYEVNVVAPLGLVHALHPYLHPGTAVVSITSDAAREPYPGWGGYGSSKAALEQLTAILAAEHPDLRVYTVDPGDMRTRMHAEAFPGEDISDRPPPEVSVPGIVALLDGDHPSGRYVARDIAPAVTS